MGRVVQCTADALAGLMAADAERLDLRIRFGLLAAADAGAHAIVPNLPIAFGDLRRSLHVDAVRFLEGHVRVVLGAPHAAAIEKGSRPHVVPLDALIKWVRLRGMQGLTQKGEIRSPGRRANGNTTAANAHHIAVTIHQMEGALYGAVPIDAPERIARAIQASIKKYGTRPHWPVRSSLPKINSALRTSMRKAVKG